MNSNKATGKSENVEYFGQVGPILKPAVKEQNTQHYMAYHKLVLLFYINVQNIDNSKQIINTRYE